MHNIKQRSLFLLEIILLAGLFVRVWGLSEYAYNGDEMQFILMAKGATLAEVWQRSLMELHPPLLHFIRHYLLMITQDIFIQRLFSVAAGMLSVFGMYRIGILLRGRALGVFSALCMAFATIAVSTSMVVRDYAFFMAPLLGAFYFFVLYQRQHRCIHLFGFAALIFLASAMSFSGFLVAAAYGMCEGYLLLKTKNWKNLLLYCASFLPLSVLGLLFYYSYIAPGTSGPMWHQLAIISGGFPADFTGRFIETAKNIYYFFVPFGGVRNLPQEGTLALSVVTMMVVGSLWLILLQVAGLRRMYALAPHLCGFILTLWAVAIAAALFDVYPFLPARHSYYLLPFFILPYGYLLTPFVEKILASTAMTRCAAACIILAALVAGGSGVYINYIDEFCLKQKDLAAAEEYLAAHLHPGDAIVTGGSAAYFYLLDAQYNGSMAYSGYGDFGYFHDSKVLAGFDAPFKPHANWQPVRAELQEENARHVVPVTGKFWFVMLGWKNEEIWRLMECKALAHQIGDFYSREGVVIFSIRQPDFLGFLKDNAAWERCYSDYKPLVIGTPFHAVQKPL